MLVFQIISGHILDDGCKCAGINPKWFLDSFADINPYLSDVWQLTLSVNNFRIQIIASKSAALIGSCYRTDSNEILHSVDSLHLTKFYDCVDLRQKSKKIRVPVKSIHKRKHRELILPDLYYFCSCAEGFETQLFVHQYEQIKYKSFPDEKAGDECRRIHPLTRNGLDLEHFMWVRWTINGDVSIVASPDHDYHGKDYWLVPKLEDDSNRAGIKTYISMCTEVLKRYGITSPATKEKPYITEFKFLIESGLEEKTSHFELVAENLSHEKNPTGFVNIGQDSRHKDQVDIYFDDNLFSLFNVGALFRIQKKDTVKATLKKRFPKQNPEKKLYQRIEEEAVITASQEEVLMFGKPINAFSYQLIPYIAPECGLIMPMVFVKNKRRILYFRANNFNPN